MNTPRLPAVLLALAVLAPVAHAAKSTSDIVSSQKRQQTVDAARRLTRPPVPLPVPSDMRQPFNPVDFEKPDPEEIRASATAAGPRPAGGGPAPAAGGPAITAAQAVALGDRELLENLAGRIVPAGYFNFAGQPLLSFPNNKRVRVGDHFFVNDKGQDYELEIVAITPTTFTLRYRGEETTRSIKPAK